MTEVPHARITRLGIKNFRSLVDVDVALSPLTVLVGANASGKSNVVEALRFVRDALSVGVQAALLRHGGVQSIQSWFRNGDEPISLELDVDGPAWTAQYSFGIAPEGEGDYRILHEILSVMEKTRAGSRNVIVLETEADRVVRYSQSSVGKTISHPWNARSIDPKRSILLFQSYTTDPITKDVYRFLTSMSFYDIDPDNIRDPQKVGNPFPLAEDGTNFATTLRELKRLHVDERINEALQGVIPNLKDYSVLLAGGFLIVQLRYLFSNGRVTENFSDLSDESDGTLRMLSILAALYQDRVAAPLALEEPEKAVHPGALGVLRDAFRSASKRYQVIVTTHSPDLIADLEADELRVVEKVNGATHIGPISERQRWAIEQSLFHPGALMRIEGLDRAEG